MKNILSKIRYILFGKQISKALANSERAGREVAENSLLSRTVDAENDLKNIKIKHELEIDQLVAKKMATLDYSVDPFKVMTILKKQDQIGRVTSRLQLDGKDINETELANFKQEVSFFRNSRLWNIFNESLKSQAREIMFTRSETFDDMKSGKMMLYNLSIMDNIMKLIESSQ